MSTSRERFFQKDKNGDLRLCGKYNEKSGAITFFKRSRELRRNLQSDTTPLINKPEESDPSCWTFFISAICGSKNTQPSPEVSSDGSTEEFFYYRGRK